MTITAINTIRAAIKTYNNVDRGWLRKRNGNHPAIQALETWMLTNFPENSTAVELTTLQKEEITSIFTQTQPVTYAYFSQAAYNAWLSILPTLFEGVTPENAAKTHANLRAAVVKKVQAADAALNQDEIREVITQTNTVKLKKATPTTSFWLPQSTPTSQNAWQDTSLTNTASLSSSRSELQSLLTPVSHPTLTTLSVVIAEHSWNEADLKATINLMCSNQSPVVLPPEISSLAELKTIQATLHDSEKFTHVLEALGEDRLKRIIQLDLAIHQALLANVTNISGLCQQLVNADLANVNTLRAILIAYIAVEQAPLLIETIQNWYREETIPENIYTALAEKFASAIFTEWGDTFKAGMATAYLTNDDLISANQLAPDTVVTHITACTQAQLAALLDAITPGNVDTLNYSVRRTLCLKAFDYLSDTTVKTKLALLLAVEPTETIDNVSLFTKAKSHDLDLTPTECDALAENVFFTDRLTLTFGQKTVAPVYAGEYANQVQLFINTDSALTYTFHQSSDAISGTIGPHILDDTHYQALRTAAAHQSPRGLPTTSKMAFFMLTDVKHPQTATLKPVDIERLAVALPAKSSLKEALFMPAVFLTAIDLKDFNTKRTEKNTLITKPKKDIFHKIHRNISDLTSISSNDIARITADFKTAITKLPVDDYRLKALENFLRVIPQPDFITLLSTMTHVDAALVSRSGIKAQDFIDVIEQHLNPPTKSKGMFNFLQGSE